MGSQSSKLRAFLRPFKNYNVEERAQKVISKEKPTAAPAHPSLKQIMDEIRRDPGLLTKGKLDPKLVAKLKEVYVTSSGKNPTITVRKGLPQDRDHPDNIAFSDLDVSEIPPGRVTLPKALEFLSKNYDDISYDAPKIAVDYKLDVNDVENILKYFKPLELITVPKDKQEIEHNPLRRLQDGIDRMKLNAK